MSVPRVFLTVSKKKKNGTFPISQVLFEREGCVCVKIIVEPAMALWTAESQMIDPAARLQGRLCMLTLGFRLAQGK